MSEEEDKCEKCKLSLAEGYITLKDKFGICYFARVKGCPDCCLMRSTTFKAI